MYLKCLIICSYLILNCCAMQLIHSPGSPSKYDYNLDNQNNIRSKPDFINRVGLKRSQPDYGSIKTVFLEPINSFSENIDFNAPPIRMTQNHWPKNRQPYSTHHNNAKRKRAIREHGQNLAALTGAVQELVEKFNKKHNSTNITETSENPLLLSPEDSKDNVPITDLINSNTPEDNHSDENTQGNSKNSKHLIKSLQKSVISNKASTINHHHNIQTKLNYKMNPDIMVGIVALTVIVLAAVIAGIVIHTRMHLLINRIC